MPNLTLCKKRNVTKNFGVISNICYLHKVHYVHWTAPKKAFVFTLDVWISQKKKHEHLKFRTIHVQVVFYKILQLKFLKSIKK